MKLPHDPSAIFVRADWEDGLTGNRQLHVASLSEPSLFATTPMRDLARLTSSFEKPALRAASEDVG